MGRLHYIDRDDLPEDFRYLWDRLGGGGDVPNIFRTLGHNPDIWLQYLRLGNALWTKSGIDVATRELTILRTAILKQSEYEWHQHVRIGRQAGLSDERMRALHEWRGSTLFSEPERAILGYVDAVAASGGGLDDAHAELAAQFPPSTVVAVNLLTGYYGMTANFLGAMAVETETPFIGWQIENG